jgi:thiol-disulfide isomerase/thioredoxin
MKRAGTLILVILLSLRLPAQYPIQVRVDSMPTRKAFLFDYVGTKTNLIDSARATADGRFSFTLPANAHPGMYRIVVGPEQFWDIIFNREPISMRTRFSAINDSLRVIESKENKLLNSYRLSYLDIQRKQELLQRLAGLYPASDPFRKEVIKELQKVRSTDPDQVAREIIGKYPDTYVAHFLNLLLSPRVPVEIPPKDQMAYILDHFWDGIDFRDTAMMYSPALANKVMSFFSFFPQAYPQQEVEGAMKKGLDRLMSAAAVNDVLFEFILENIAQWAERTEFDDFFSYLTEDYLSQASCTDDKKKGEFKDLVESYQKTAPGKQVPEIVIPRENKGALIMSQLPSKYILVLFWASWCPHCQEMLPKLERIYGKYDRKDFEIVAISLDEKEKDWQDAIRKNGYNWINYSELKGWDCPIAYDYGIRATPTMILIDHNRTVIARPRTPEMLEQKLKELGINPIKK